MSETKVKAADIRTWARANGFTVGDRGRLSEKVKAAYAEATKSGR